LFLHNSWLLHLHYQFSLFCIHYSTCHRSINASSSFVLFSITRLLGNPQSINAIKFHRPSLCSI
jgi:hypothetical protein